MHQGPTFSHGSDEPQERQIIHVNPWKWQRVNLVLWRNQLGVFQRDVHQTSAAIVGWIFVAQFVLQTHLSQGC